MRPGVAWRGEQAELFEEAMRVVPAAAKHRSGGSLGDVAALYREYHARAQEFGIDRSTAWAILASAQAIWLQNLFELYAHECGVAVDGAIDSAIAAAVDWVGDRG